MWEEALPGVDDMLRQGDLLVDVPSPRRGTFSLAADGLAADVYGARRAIVLDQCCTVANKHTVLLARVSDNVRKLPAENQMTQSLERMVPEPGMPYAKYVHPLQDLEEHLPTRPSKRWVVEMLERVSLPVKDLDDLQWLQELRVARMTPLARAHLRLRMQVHFTDLAEEDVEALAAAGLDRLGRPTAE